MIIEAGGFSRLSGEVALVGGGFDPLHPGHIRYFEAAAGLGLPLFVSVANDTYVRKKHPPLLTEEERIHVIDALRPVSYTHLEVTTTLDVLRALRPAYYVKGNDWVGMLPRAEQEACDALGIQVVHLDTVTNSSSRILERFLAERVESAAFEGPGT